MPVTERKPLTSYQGVVASKSGDRTVRVVMTYLQKHPKYGKIMRRRTVAHVHDQNNQARVGDRVEIVKCRPLSKTKHWRLVRVVGADPVSAGQG
jgi:small subunit ribosomal protein S17